MKCFSIATIDNHEISVTVQSKENEKGKREIVSVGSLPDLNGTSQTVVTLQDGEVCVIG